MALYALCGLSSIMYNCKINCSAMLREIRHVKMIWLRYPVQTLMPWVYLLSSKYLRTVNFVPCCINWVCLIWIWEERLNFKEMNHCVPQSYVCSVPNCFVCKTWCALCAPIIMSLYRMYQATSVSMFTIPVKWYRYHIFYDYCECQSIAIDQHLYTPLTRNAIVISGGFCACSHFLSFVEVSQRAPI